MVFGLPAIGETTWGQKILDSINAVKAVADAAQPSATLDSAVTAVDSDSGSAFRVQQDARLAARFARVGIIAPGVNGIVGDGTTDDTTAIQAVLTASDYAHAAAGTYAVTSLSGRSGTVLGGEGIGKTVFKRIAGATGTTAPLSYVGKTGFTVRDLTVDGNKANQTVGANNIQISGGCSDWNLERVGSINAKLASGYGGGIAVVDGANDTTVELSRIKNCRVVSNDGEGIYINKEFYIEVAGNLCKSNGKNGITAQNYVFPPVADQQKHLTITNNQCHSNGENGIQVHGYYTAGASEADKVFGATTPASRFVQVANNHCSFNSGYGVAFQGAGGAITGNTASRNGDDASNGGYLLNAWASTFSGNTAHDNFHYGLDAGGAHHCVISNNTFQNNGVTSGLGPIDINLGAAIGSVCTSNAILQAGAVAGTAIGAAGVDGTTDADPFPTRGGKLIISQNMVTMNGVAGGRGIIVRRQFDSAVVKDNMVSGASAANEAFILEVGSLVQSGNIDARVYSGGTNVPTIASAATLVIPDVGEDFYVSGTTGITGIRSFSNSVWDQKVRSVNITAGGSGYSQAAPPTVTFSGGGGAGAAGTAVVSRAGAVVDVLITNPGSGYTSAPTVAFSSGTAAGAATVGCSNAEGRVITLLFTGALTVTDGGNLKLAGNLVTTALATTLTLRGAFGQWHEIARSVY